MPAATLVIVLVGFAAAPSRAVDPILTLRAEMMPYLKCDRTFDVRRVAMEKRIDGLYSRFSSRPSTTDEAKERDDQLITGRHALERIEQQIATECGRKENFERLAARIASWPNKYTPDQNISFTTRVFFDLADFERRLADHRLGRYSGFVTIPAPQP
jgi:hypothetical protein